MNIFVLSFAFLAVLPPVCLGGGWIRIKYLSYNNPGGKGANGNCCDGLGIFCQKNGCDHYFRMCLAKRESGSAMGPCPYGAIDVDRTKDTDSITFGPLIGRWTKNPMVFKLPLALPHAFSIKVKVMDKDKWNSHDDVDTLRLNLELYQIRDQKKWVIQSRTRLHIEIEVGCDSGYFGEYCDQRCIVGGNIIRCSDDGTPVCKSGWSGTGCKDRVTCGKDEFTCGNGECVGVNSRCDGYKDCTDDSDEAGCVAPTEAPTEAPEQCPESKFTCDDGACIPENKVCDGDSDCVEGEDEQGCDVTCAPDEFTCDHGDEGIFCIDKAYVCDGSQDCDNGEDEKDCPTKKPSACEDDEFQCVGDNKCIKEDWTCDGESDCDDGSDEANVLCKGRTCNANEFKCTDGKCIRKEWKCDEEADCDDGSDEDDCPKR